MSLTGTNPFRDIVPAPAGGSISGARTEGGAFANGYTEASWVTVFIFYIIYLIFVFLAPLFNKYARKYAEQPRTRPPVMVATGGQGVSVVTNPPPDEAIAPTQADLAKRASKQRKFMRATNMGNAARDGLTILLGSALITMAGYGFRYSAMVIMWIIFAILVVWMFFAMLPRTSGWILDFLLILIIAVLSIITWGLSFSNVP